MTSRAADILAFWFEPRAHDAAQLRQHVRRWYQGGPTLDAEIRARFGDLVEQALAGQLTDWEAAPRDRLALVIVLDQFTRSIYRDDPRAFAGDLRAQQLAVDALDRGLDRDLTVEERNFLIMPLLHAEDLALQERGCAEIRRIVDDAAAWQAEVFAMGIEQSTKFRDIIRRFGRFPHRNSVLGRTPTPEETAFLADWATKGPPSAAR
jgi:uncharacterized protein (DUF924 family)